MTVITTCKESCHRSYLWFQKGEVANTVTIQLFFFTGSCWYYIISPEIAAQPFCVMGELLHCGKEEEGIEEIEGERKQRGRSG